MTSGLTNLKHQPLSVVLAEFRYSPVLKIGGYIPDIQESLRQSFPRYEERRSQHVTLKDGEVEITSNPSYVLVSVDKNTMLEIDERRLIIVTSQYHDFDSFKAGCTPILETIVERIQPRLLERLGLRFNSLIEPIDGESFGDYLVPSLLPLELSDQDQLAIHRDSNIYQTSSGQLIVGTYFSSNGFSVMPEIAGKLSINVRDRKNEGNFIAVLDLDHWAIYTDDVSFDPNNVFTKLTELHEKIEKTFVEITTKTAREQKWA